MLANRCNNLRSLSKLDILIRSPSEVDDSDGYDFSHIFCKKLQPRSISHLQISEMCFARGSLRTLLGNVEKCLTSLHLRLVTFEDLSAFHDELWALPRMDRMASLDLTLLNTYDGTEKIGIRFKDNQTSYSWTKEFSTFQECAIELHATSHVSGPEYEWADYSKREIG
jgi:hypothetical protein